MKNTQKDAIKCLKRIVKPTTKIVVIQKSVSQSGMSRRLQIYALKNNRLVWITPMVANAIDWSYNDKGLYVSGCGMDMHFHTVDTLSYYLFPKGSKKFAGNGGSCLEWQSM